ncbi:hypothetical protein C7E12_20860, partial [Stenotrophomonas maltophilia]
SGRGYRGFVVDADPAVTLEEDLQRRDFTINAIAVTSRCSCTRTRVRNTHWRAPSANPAAAIAASWSMLIRP